jgi:hypothetical protein
MVNEVSWRGQTIYECEICGFGYLELETAERCEHYCYTHERASPKITEKAVRKPSARVDPIAA